MDILSKFLTPIIGFLVTVAFGFWLGKIGKPYNNILFNVHKLIALGIVILSSLQVYKIFKVIEPQSLLLISLTGAVICVLVIFASGAFLSIGNVSYETAKLTHNIALVGMVIATGISIYLFSGGST